MSLLSLEFPSVDIFPSAAGVPFDSVTAVAVVPADSSIPALKGSRQ